MRSNIHLLFSCSFLICYFNKDSDIVQLFSSSIMDDSIVVINIQQTDFWVISSIKAHISQLIIITCA